MSAENKFPRDADTISVRERGFGGYLKELAILIATALPRLIHSGASLLNGMAQEKQANARELLSRSRANLASIDLERDKFEHQKALDNRTSDTLSTDQQRFVAELSRNEKRREALAGIAREIALLNEVGVDVQIAVVDRSEVLAIPERADSAFPDVHHTD